MTEQVVKLELKNFTTELVEILTITDILTLFKMTQQHL